MAEDCLFCKIIAGDVPSNEVYSDEEFFAFEDINPAAPSHLLVIPKRHVENVSASGSEDESMLGRLLLTANKVAAEASLVENGFRYVINCGQHGGQTVAHLHLHILGGRFMSWPPG